MFRKAIFNDCDAVYNLICDMEKTELPKGGFSEIFNEQLSDNHYYCLICEIDDRIVGVLNLRFENQLHHAAKIAEIMEFVVDENYRNKEIGRKIFSRACDIAKENGCIQIEVACNQLRIDTHRFYDREDMNNFHYKFSKPLEGETYVDNKLGR